MPTAPGPRSALSTMRTPARSPGVADCGERVIGIPPSVPQSVDAGCVSTMEAYRVELGRGARFHAGLHEPGTPALPVAPELQDEWRGDEFRRRGGYVQPLGCIEDDLRLSDGARLEHDPPDSVGRAQCVAVREASASLPPVRPRWDRRP